MANVQMYPNVPTVGEDIDGAYGSVNSGRAGSNGGGVTANTGDDGIVSTNIGPAVITDKSGNGVVYRTTSGSGNIGGGAGMMSAVVAPMPPHQLQIFNPPYGPRAMNVVCPSCHEQQMTRVEYNASTKTHIIALLLCGLCCCCIPYCMNSCKNLDHMCSKCGSYLGTYKQ